MISASYEREAIGRTENDAGREIAMQLEQQHPLWIVMYGPFTKEFVCLPRFAAPSGLMIVAMYPKAAEDRMSEVERLCRIRDGLRAAGEGGETRS
jgi:hypothetical protein